MAKKQSTSSRTTSGTKTAPRRARAPRGASAPKGPPVRVRMYRQGLGDCFLITFGDGAKSQHMLIDCGTLGRSASKRVALGGFVEKIRQDCNDKLAVVVATHEHQDHVSGFRQNLWDGINVGRVWLAWTENPDDKLAKRIKVFRDDLGAALAAAIRATPLHEADEHGLPSSAAEAGLFVRDVLGFGGDPDAMGAADFAKTVDKAMKFVRDGLGTRPTYLKPGGKPIVVPEIPGFRFYVLGPPRDEDDLADLGERLGSDLYGFRAAALGLGAASARVEVSQRTAEECALQMPFDERHQFASPERAREWYPAYFEEGEAWRGIKTDWLSGMSELALQLDNMTNNTSLVLAIERIADGRVLLFPADAQSGNWKTWKQYEWPATEHSGAGTPVTAKDLLARTVFYKVGHHASHNATAREDGLELMTRGEELVAFIPVDRAIALGRNPKGSWRMPARELYRRLLERCEGRVVRSDTGWAIDASKASGPADESELEDLATSGEWKNWKAVQRSAEQSKKIAIDELSIDYHLK